MRGFILFAVLVIGLALPARAGDDVAAARTVINSQAEALGRDDAAGAYAFAAPGIQRMFGEPGSFMNMVRNAYAPIYRHRTFEFGEASMTDDKIEQKVHIIDADGVPWDALYTLELQADGSLKISGCMLLKVGQAV